MLPTRRRRTPNLRVRIHPNIPHYSLPTSHSLPFNPVCLQLSRRQLLNPASSQKPRLSLAVSHLAPLCPQPSLQLRKPSLQLWKPSQLTLVQLNANKRMAKLKLHRTRRPRRPREAAKTRTRNKCITSTAFCYKLCFPNILDETLQRGLTAGQ